MMFIYISVVRSSYIIIVSGIGDDVPILGALVTLYAVARIKQCNKIVGGNQDAVARIKQCNKILGVIRMQWLE